MRHAEAKQADRSFVHLTPTRAADNTREMDGLEEETLDPSKAPTSGGNPRRKPPKFEEVHREAASE